MENSTSTSTSSWRFTRRCLIVLAALVTLIAVLYIEEDLRGRLAWAAAKQECIAKGLTLDPHALEPARVPDDENFAATPFLAVMLDFNPEPLKPGQSRWRDDAGYQKTSSFAKDFYKTYDSARTKLENNGATQLDLITLAGAMHKQAKTTAPDYPTRAAAATDLMPLFDSCNPVLDELRVAAKRPYSRFNIQYDTADPMEILLPHLAVVKKVALVTAYRASAELALGKNDAAFNDVQLTLSMADSLRGEPFMISHLVRLAIIALARPVIWEGLSKHVWSDQQLQELQARLSKNTVLADSTLSMHWELGAHTTTLFEFIKHNPPSTFYENAGLNGAAIPLRLIPSGWLDMERASYARLACDSMQAGFDAQPGIIHPKPVDEQNRKTDKLFADRWGVILHHRLFASLVMPATAKFCQRSAFGQTTVNEAVIACALEHYRRENGQFPGNLDALAPKYLAEIPRDVINGDPLKYQPIGANQFRLYSVGWNETDDGGKSAVTTGPSRDFAKGDWTWEPYAN